MAKVENITKVTVTLEFNSDDYNKVEEWKRKHSNNTLEKTLVRLILKGIEEPTVIYKEVYVNNSDWTTPTPVQPVEPIKVEDLSLGINIDDFKGLDDEDNVFTPMVKEDEKALE